MAGYTSLWDRLYIMYPVVTYSMEGKGHIEERNKQTNKVKGFLRGESQIIIKKIDTRHGKKRAKGSQSQHVYTC